MPSGQHPAKYAVPRRRYDVLFVENGDHPRRERVVCDLRNGEELVSVDRAVAVPVYPDEYQLHLRLSGSSQMEGLRAWEIPQARGNGGDGDTNASSLRNRFFSRSSSAALTGWS